MVKAKDTEAISLLAILGDPVSTGPDFADALETYVEADRARQAVERELERAQQKVQERETELRAIYARLKQERAD
jgi:hypothetical protein